MSRARFLIAGVVLLCLFSCALSAPASAAALREVLKTTAELVTQERFGEAIREAEAAADHGVVDADLSFNRGLSYLRRAGTSAAEPGDLAQAAAGFAEALELESDDPEAARGLEQARLLIAQDRTQTGSTPDTSNLGILERVLLGLPPFLLVLVAGSGSLTLSIGIWLLSSPVAARRVPGSIAALVGALLLLPALLLASLRHTMFHDARVAVVIAEGAEVVDASGKRLALRLTYRKGTVLHVGPAEGGLVPLLNFGEEGFVPMERLRFLEGDR